MNKKTIIGTIAILIAMGAVGFIAWKIGSQSVQPVATPAPFAKPTQAPPAQSTAPAQLALVADETANWQTYTDEKYGFSFKYPENMQFAGSEVINPVGILATISSNYEMSGDNFFYFTINDKTTANNDANDANIDRITAGSAGLDILKEITIPNGKIIVTMFGDGIGPAGDYFRSAHLKGNKYNFAFELSGRKYSNEIEVLFEKIISTFRFIK